MPARYHPRPTPNKNNRSNNSVNNSNVRPPQRSQQNQPNRQQPSYANVVRNPQIRGRDQSQKSGTNASIHKPVIMTENMISLNNTRFEKLHNMIEKLTNTVSQMSKSVENLNERVANLESKIDAIEQDNYDYNRDYAYNEDLMDEEADKHHAIKPSTKRNPYENNPHVFTNPYEYDENEWGVLPQQSTSNVIPPTQSLSPNTPTGQILLPQPSNNEDLHRENAELKKQCAELNNHMNNLASNMQTITTELARLRNESSPTTQQ
jgi:DNA repair exonuclease SbcCD ATPase subunit